MVEKGKLNICQIDHEYENYCKECKILCCSECSSMHLEHLEALMEWPLFTDEYINKCRNKLLHTKVIAQAEMTVESQDLLQAEMFAKIDNAFDTLVNKIRELQIRYKTETWENRNKLLIQLTKDSHSPKTIEEIAENLQRIIAEFNPLNDQSDILEFMKCNNLEVIKGEITNIQSRRIKELNHIKFIREYQITESLNYNKLIKLFDQTIPQKPKKQEKKKVVVSKMPILSSAYLWPNQSKILSNSGPSGAFSIYSISHPLPTERSFKMKLKIIEESKEGMSIGVGNIILEGQRANWPGYNTQGEWGYASHGYIDGDNQGNIQVEGYGKGDTVIIFYKAPGQKLVFRKGGKPHKIIRVFNGVFSPLYLHVSFYSTGASVQLVNIEPIS